METLHSLSGAENIGLLGDKEITVGIRGNSHYRISAGAPAVKSECLSPCDA